MTKSPAVTQEFIDMMRERRNDENYNAMMRINDINKLRHDIVRKNAEDNGMPSSYRLLLYHLSKLEPGVTQLTLVKAANLKPPTVSVTLQKMEADGLVIRKSNEHDLRQTLVYLSDKGREVNEKIRASFVSGDAVAIGGLTADENKQLCQLLDKIADSLIEAR